MSEASEVANISSPEITSGLSETIGWDDLDTLEAPKPKAEKVEKKEKIPLSGEKGPENDEDGDDKSARKERSKEAKKGDAKEKDQAPSGESGGVDNDENSDEKPKGRVIKGRQGDKDVELASDIVITHKVDGKPTQITLEEALSDYSGRASLAKRHGELVKWEGKRKEYDGERQVLVEGIDKFYEKSKEDPIGAVSDLLNTTGVDTADFIRNHIKASYDLAQRLVGLDEEEVEAYMEAQVRDFELQHYKNKEERRRSGDERKQKQTVYHQAASAAKEDYGIADEDYDGFAASVAKEAGINPTDVEAKDVVYSYGASLCYKAVQQANPEMLALMKNGDAEAGERIKGVWRMLVDFFVKDKLTPDELVDIAKEGLRAPTISKAAKRLSQKVQKTDSGSSVTTAAKNDGALLSWDDL